MRRILFLLPLFLAACGSETATTVRQLQISVAEPSELQSLPADQRSLYLSLLPSGTNDNEAVAITLTSSETNRFVGETEPVTAGNYEAVFTLEQQWSGDQSVTVASSQISISIVKGQKTVIIDLGPSDFTTDIDSDSDGLSNLLELQESTSPYLSDTDGDGIADASDLFPSLSTEFGDIDGDGVGDNLDNCSLVANAAQTDTDLDARGDACDEDDDADTLSDSDEALLGTNSLKKDSDEDTIEDATDNCPLTANKDQADADGDGVGNSCDADDDNDGVADAVDNCPFLTSTNQTDSDADGVGDVCINDDDGDGVLDSVDNCRTVANSTQLNRDLDTQGDACDADDDNDSLSDAEESGAGEDGLITNSLSEDTDGDGVEDGLDNCRITSNADQSSDADIDGEGDACDCDTIDSNIQTTKAVFVSPDGDDSQAGARNRPVKTINRALSLAQIAGKSQIYLNAGTYSENLTVASGLSIYGGFSLSADGESCEKKLYDDGEVNTTTISSASGTTITFSNISDATELEGVTVTSSASSGNLTLVSVSSTTASSVNNLTIRNTTLLIPDMATAEVTALSISKASPLLVNNLIDAGNAQESVGIFLKDSPAAKIIHNTIRGGGSVATSTALLSQNSVSTLLNNILFTEGGSQNLLYFKDSVPSSSIICRNNLLFGLAASGEDAPKLYRDLDSSLDHIYSTIADLNLVDGAGENFDGNITLTDDGLDSGNALDLTDLFSDPSGGDYRLESDSIAADQGVDLTDFGLTVDQDRDGNNRSDGSPDLGCFEEDV